MSWGRGDVIVVQEVWRERLWAARPLTVVDDRGDELVLWSPKGTRRKVPITPPTRPDPETRGERSARLLDLCDWVLGDSVWDVSTLWLLRPGDWHAVWVSFLETGEQLGWYVNFQEPFARTSRGIRTMDLALDIVVEADRSAWRWKDEDEFEVFVERGLLDGDVAQRVRSEATAVVDRIRRDASPFDSDWPEWRPPRSWGIPELPDGWDNLDEPGPA